MFCELRPADDGWRGFSSCDTGDTNLASLTKIHESKESERDSAEGDRRFCTRIASQRSRANSSLQVAVFTLCDTASRPVLLYHIARLPAMLCTILAQPLGGAPQLSLALLIKARGRQHPCKWHQVSLCRSGYFRMSLLALFFLSGLSYAYCTVARHLGGRSSLRLVRGWEGARLE
jgi:hypothetical protein